MILHVAQFGISPTAGAELAADSNARHRDRLHGVGVRLKAVQHAFGGVYDGGANYEAADAASADAATAVRQAVGPGRAFLAFELREHEQQRDATRRVDAAPFATGSPPSNSHVLAEAGR